MYRFEFAGGTSQKKGRTGANRLESVKSVRVPQLIWPRACDIPSLLVELTSLQDIHVHTEHKCSSLQKMFQTKTCQRHSWETWQNCKFLCSVSSICIHLTREKNPQVTASAVDGWTPLFLLLKKSGFHLDTLCLKTSQWEWFWQGTVLPNIWWSGCNLSHNMSSSCSAWPMWWLSADVAAS